MEKFWEILKIIYENIIVAKYWSGIAIVYGWVLLFIPSLIASCKKNTKKWQKLLLNYRKIRKFAPG